jgi:hypothetical protein
MMHILSNLKIVVILLRIVISYFIINSKMKNIY